jgi:hypothetical protein
LSNITISDSITDYECAQPCVFNCSGPFDNNPNWTVHFNTQIQIYNLSNWEFPNIDFDFLTGGADFEIHVLQGTTSFIPTHYGFNPNVTVEYIDPHFTPHDMFQGVMSYGWLPDASEYNKDGPSEAAYDFAPFSTTVTFLLG